MQRGGEAEVPPQPRVCGGRLDGARTIRGGGEGVSTPRGGPVSPLVRHLLLTRAYHGVARFEGSDPRVEIYFPEGREYGQGVSVPEGLYRGNSGK